MTTQSTLRIRMAKKPDVGKDFFYIESQKFGKEAKEYAVKYIHNGIRKTWECTCPDYFYRKGDKNRHCKHIHFARYFLGRVGDLKTARNIFSALKRSDRSHLHFCKKCKKSYLHSQSNCDLILDTDGHNCRGRGRR